MVTTCCSTYNSTTHRRASSSLPTSQKTFRQQNNASSKLSCPRPSTPCNSRKSSSGSASSQKQPKKKTTATLQEPIRPVLCPGRHADLERSSWSPPSRGTAAHQFARPRTDSSSSLRNQQSITTKGDATNLWFV